MLDLRRIQENKEKVAELLSRKGFTADFDTLLALDKERRAVIGEVETYKAEKNKVSAKIPALKKAGQPVDEIFAEMRALGDKIAECDAISFTYTVAYDGVTYKLTQTVFARQGLVYSLTYTATESGFDAHLEDVEAMMDAFIFR